MIGWLSFLWDWTSSPDEPQGTAYMTGGDISSPSASVNALVSPGVLNMAIVAPGIETMDLTPV